MKHGKEATHRTEVLRARCAPELKAAVAEHARQRGHDEADVVRQAVIEFLNRTESPAKAEVEATQP